MKPPSFYIRLTPWYKRDHGRIFKRAVAWAEKFGSQWGIPAEYNSEKLWWVPADTIRDHP